MNIPTASPLPNPEDMIIQSILLLEGRDSNCGSLVTFESSQYSLDKGIPHNPGFPS